MLAQDMTPLGDAYFRSHNAPDAVFAKLTVHNIIQVRVILLTAVPVADGRVQLDHVLGRRAQRAEERTGKRPDRKSVHFLYFFPPLIPPPFFSRQ